ncbi:hypothetical protein U2P60_13220 [Brucella sp. H1_1004]|uniref:hypothetical protein n=1 Tax=Brucella sp. H1_1004 TaxID=3110109 RepID=UPI0039B4367D
MDPDLQDRLGYHLAIRRGYNDYISGNISRTEFGRRLAQEWASFPVLAPTRGAHRALQRGETFYAGDSSIGHLLRLSAWKQFLIR